MYIVRNSFVFVFVQIGKLLDGDRFGMTHLII